ADGLDRGRHQRMGGRRLGASGRYASRGGREPDPSTGDPQEDRRTRRPAPCQTRACAPGELMAMRFVTRSKVHVDRIATAWAIQRFIDPEATFVFVDRNADVSGLDAIP